METRTTLSFVSADNITNENYIHHIPAIAHSLNLDTEKLQSLVDGSSLDTFNQSLMDSYQEIMSSIDKSIANAVTPDAAEPVEMQLYYDHQLTHLNQLRNELDHHLQERLQAISEQQRVATDLVTKKITGSRDCYFGNYARKLEALKHNIAIATQTTPDTFTTQTLAQSQEIIDDIFSKNTRPTNSVKADELQHAFISLANHRSAALKNGDALFEFHDNQFTFTPVAAEVEQLATSAAELANRLINTLEYERTDSLSDFEYDSGKLQRTQSLRDTIKYVIDGKAAYRNIISRVKDLSSAIDQDRNEIDSLLATLQGFVSEDPDTSRNITEKMLANLNFPHEIKQRIINGMQEVMNHLHMDFVGHIGFDFRRIHYLALADQLRGLQVEMDSLLQEAACATPPLTAFAKRCDDIAKQRDALLKSLTEFYRFVEKMRAEHDDLHTSFNKARANFIEFLDNTQHNDWQEDLLQRLDATLLTIDDLNEKYGNHPVYQHTSLRGVITDVLDNARAKTLATKATVTPGFMPLDAQPAPKLSFSQRHPVLAKVLFSALIGVSAAMLGTLIAGAVIFTAGAALAPLVIAGILVGSAVATSATGYLAGNLIYDKTHPQAAPAQPDIRKQPPSSTALALKVLNDADGDALDRRPVDVVECYESSDEEHKAVNAGDTIEVIFSGDSKEFSPRQQRRI